MKISSMSLNKKKGQRMKRISQTQKSCPLYDVTVWSVINGEKYVMKSQLFWEKSRNMSECFPVYGVCRGTADFFYRITQQNGFYIPIDLRKGLEIEGNFDSSSMHNLVTLKRERDLLGIRSPPTQGSRQVRTWSSWWIS